jgi:hypothetical protein
MEQIRVMNISNLERTIMTVLWTVGFAAALAAFSVGLLVPCQHFRLGGADHPSSHTSRFC